jgi:predicted nucleic acid-binding protein
MKNIADRLKFSLESLQPSNWQIFENAATAFLAKEFDNLRTTATTSGDKGRDAELFEAGNVTVMVQLSIRKDWKTKIDETLTRIQKTFPETRILVYVTNQLIGANADQKKVDVLNSYGIYLDVRDQNWFVDRVYSNEGAAEALSSKIVDPLLSRKKIIAKIPTALNSLEQQAALIYLELQWQDDVREKSLTKTAFEALVRSVVRDTSSSEPMSRAEILVGVKAILPNLNSREVEQHTNRALAKLSAKKDERRILKYNPAEDVFHTSYEETQRLNEYLLSTAIQEQNLISEITALMHSISDKFVQQPETTEISAVITCARQVLEGYLFSRGEYFSSSIRNGYLEVVELQSIKDATISLFSKDSSLKSKYIPLVASIVKEIAFSPAPAIKAYLRKLLDAYTLLSLLTATPDVSSAIEKIVGNGSVWLDTNIVLQLITEQMILEEDQSYTKLLQIASDAGLELYITEGVLEELVSQISKAKAFNNYRATWQGKVPHLYASFASSRISSQSFNKWIDELAGDERPSDDLADYLDEIFNIKTLSLLEELERIPEQLRFAVQEYWINVHEERRGERGEEIDANLMKRLADHDVENYLGVIAKRANDKNHLGYSTWWLTLDKAAWPLTNTLRKYYSKDIASSPVMSPDFFAGFLTFGSKRSRISRANELQLPVALGNNIDELIPKELLEIVEKIRSDSVGLSDRVIKRNIRDMVDRAHQKRSDFSGRSTPE